MGLLFIVALLGCGQAVSSNIENNDDLDIEGSDDFTAPEITFSPIEGTQAFGEDVPLDAVVLDEGSGVLALQVWYKNETEGDGAWSSSNFTLGDQETGAWSAIIPGAAARSGGMDYYLEAVDRAENVSWSPDDGENDPYHLRLAQ